MLESTTEEKQKFGEMQQLEIEVAKLKKEREAIESDLARITVKKKDSVKWARGVTDQFETEQVEYSEFLDPVKGRELTSKLNEINSKIDRAQGHRDHLMTEVVQKRIQREDAADYKKKMDAQRTFEEETKKQQQPKRQSFFDRIVNKNNTTTKSVHPTQQPTVDKSAPKEKISAELREEQRKSIAFRQVKELYKNVDLARRLDTIWKGKTVDLNKVYKYATAEELEELIAIRQGQLGVMKREDRIATSQYEKQGKSYTQIEKSRDNSHWRQFINELNEIEKRSKNGSRGR